MYKILYGGLLMNTITCTANISTETINFRTTFKPLLNDKNRQFIQQAFCEFCKEYASIAFDILWKLTYRDDAVDFIYKKGLYPEYIHKDKVIVLRNELRHQYKKVNPDFMEHELPEGCKEALKKLEKETDAITANAVYEQISKRLQLNYGGLDRTIFLLKCEQENMYCGGIGDIGFDKYEVEYLKPYHEQIRELFEAMYKRMFGDAEPNRPFADLKELLDESGVEVAPVSWTQAKATPPTWTAYDSQATPEKPNKTQNEVTKDEEENSMTERNVTVSKILEHQDTFLGLYSHSQSVEWMQKLRCCGFDLNEIAEKWDKIQKLLKSANDLGI